MDEGDEYVPQISQMDFMGMDAMGGGYYDQPPPATAAAMYAADVGNVQQQQQQMNAAFRQMPNGKIFYT